MKATIHTVEAVIGALILMVGVMSIYPIEGSSDFHFSDEGYNCLRYLDESGLLRSYAYNGMTDELNNSLYDCLPKITGYAFSVCMTTSCTTSLPSGKSVFLSSYLVSGENSYSPRIINLWLWLK
jgi:hypothetical protein